MNKTNNYTLLLEELNWLEKVINQVIRTYLLQEGNEQSWEDLPLPDLTSNETPYASVIQKYSLGKFERLAMALAIAPHVKPELLDVFIVKNQLTDRRFTEFGGVVNEKHNGFLPTIQTLHFLISSNQPENRIKCMDLYALESVLIQEGLLVLNHAENDYSPLNTVLTIDSSWIDNFILGEKTVIQLGSTFPTQKISTALEWGDVVLNNKVIDQLEDMVSWLKNSDTIMETWGLSKVLKPGYRALFYGPPGTGKTLMATLLGKSTQREVYKVDLSMIVSKYIGETEKNISKVFDLAKSRDWILFFDEADALFGNQTDVHSSNFRQTKRQSSYLLQKIEDFPGVIILASNQKIQIEESFIRRFQTMIHFPIPDVEERLQLWQNVFSMGCKLHEEVDLMKLAETYKLAGGAIINVMRFCALKAVKREVQLVTQSDILQGIKREFQKVNQ
jgi:AAA+ superfamily predicted ATPase